MTVLTKEALEEVLVADFERGLLFWKQRDRKFFRSDASMGTWNTRYAGQEALASVHPVGYKRGCIFARYLFAHRVLFAMAHNTWPVEVDHINGDRLDNRLVNLRAVSTQQNRMNAQRMSRNTSGVTGVHWHRTHDKWCAKITVSGKTTNLGLFDDFSDAVAARSIAESEFGFHKNHGRHAPLTEMQIAN